MNETPDSKELDAQFYTLLRRWHRLRWIVLSVTAIVLVAAIAVAVIVLYSSNKNTQRQLRQDEVRLTASCEFFQPLTGIALMPSPKTGRPTEALVQIVAGARIAFQGQGCPGKMLAPDPSLGRWAAYYHIPTGREAQHP
jgi:hypothetical protein